MEPYFVITLFADGLAPKNTRPLTGTVLVEKVNYIIFLFIVSPMNVYFHSLQSTMYVSIESKPLSNPNTIKWSEYTIHNCGPLELSTKNSKWPFSWYSSLAVFHKWIFSNHDIILPMPCTHYKYKILHGNGDFDSNGLIPNLAIANNFHGRTQKTYRKYPSSSQKVMPLLSPSSWT